MKKIALGIALIGILMLSGCNGDKKENTTLSSSTETSNTTKKKDNEKKEQSQVITTLNTPGEIKKDGKIMYTIEVTEVKDVTEEAKSYTVNTSNALDQYSNGQGKQAVEVTLLLKNDSGEDISMPFIDTMGIKVLDGKGINHVGGYKREEGSITQFNMYITDNAGGYRDDLYTVKNGESRLATSVILFANETNKLKFVFSSTFDKEKEQSIEFDLPIQK